MIAELINAAIERVIYWACGLVIVAGLIVMAYCGGVL
jgi:hypothetical protein